MTKYNAKEFLPFVRALAEGKTIEVMDSSGNWRADSAPTFSSYGPHCYRIKSEPREFWVSIHPAGIFTNKTRHEAEAIKAQLDCETIKVREVME
jgi:hypothetical protein